MNKKIIISLMSTSIYILSGVDLVAENFFIGGSYNISNMINKMNTNANDGYQSSNKLHNKYNYSIMLGKYFNDNLFGTISYTRGKLSHNDTISNQLFITGINSSSTKGSGIESLDLSYKKFSLDLNYRFLPNSKFRPYVGVGVGYYIKNTSDYIVKSVTNSTAFFKTQAAEKRSYGYNINLGLEYSFSHKDNISLYSSVENIGKILNDKHAYNFAEGVLYDDVPHQKRQSNVYLYSVGVVYKHIF